MVEQKVMELTLSHEDLKNTSTCGEILTENKMETSRKTLYCLGDKNDSHRIGQKGKKSDQVRPAQLGRGDAQDGESHGLRNPSWGEGVWSHTRGAPAVGTDPQESSQLA